MISRQHSVERTNPKGEPFRGVCVLCGQTDMSMEAAMTTECPNQRGLTPNEALVERVSPVKH